MGGATSKFEETDWSKSDGKLESREDTLDGRFPTGEHGVYYLTKRGLSQREFDVTDDDQNLLYSTKAVPGTLACFDICGREINQYLLRVNVDIARRYWMVYRYNAPSFQGQKPDDEATQKVAVEFAERQEPCSTPVLFRKACITVSWSRYMAVAAMFGAPTVDMLLPNSKDQGEADSSHGGDDSLFMEASKIASRMVRRTGCNEDEGDISDTKEEPDFIADEPIRLSYSMPELYEPPSRDFSDDPEEIPSSATARSEPEVEEPFRITAESSQNVKAWINKQSKQIREKSKHYLNQAKAKAPEVDPLEGVIRLNKPLILCQEIYNKIIGNHQTSLVSKDEVLELLKEDMAQHLAEHPEDSNTQGGDNLLLSAEELVLSSESPDDGKSNGLLRGGETKCKDEVEQPLVAYWWWENTLRTHKMKMHVAKGVDLSLHVVLAIIVNQVRYERNAIAMTV